MSSSRDNEIYGIAVKGINERREVIYVVSEDTRKILCEFGKIFADLAKISGNFILPETNDELICLATNILRAKRTGEPITLYTPLCPDWSMDSEGRYDFKSLSGSESFIAKKFFRYSPELLRVFVSHGVPYKGILIFADWGMETEIMDKNTYGTTLTQEDIRMCFDSSFAAVDEHLGRLQQDHSTNELYAPFKAVLMTGFFEGLELDLDDLDAQFRRFFGEHKDGKRLYQRLAAESYPINHERMGLSKEKSDAEVLENLVDYAIFGQALSGYGMIIACESRTTSIGYNIARSANDKVPMFFVKGKGKDSGVNILQSI